LALKVLYIQEEIADHLIEVLKGACQLTFARKPPRSMNPTAPAFVAGPVSDGVT